MPDRMLLRGKIPAGVEDSGVEVELEAAAGDDPPGPENVTPGVVGVLASGLEELVVVPPVKIPPGPKVIPLAAGVEEDEWSTVAAITPSGVATVGGITTKGTAPLEAAEEAEVNGSG
jgi:hypothetical protein